MTKFEDAVVVEKPKFNPQINYQWQPTDTFPLKGMELHMLKQILTAITAPAEAQRAIAAYEALKLVDNIIKEGVEEGIIKEATTKDMEPEKS